MIVEHATFLVGDNPEIRFLVFLAVAERGSFSAAARHLRRAQSAVRTSLASSGPCTRGEMRARSLPIA